MNHFGAPTEQLLKKKHEELVLLAMNVYGISPVELKQRNGKWKIKKDIVNIIKRKQNERRKELNERSKRLEAERVATERATLGISVSELLEALPVTRPRPDTVPLNAPIEYRQRQEDYEHSSKRLPAGSKVIRKEPVGLTNKQKSEIRKGIREEIDRLSELLERF